MSLDILFQANRTFIRIICAKPKADKVPLNALNAFKESWGKLEPVMQMLRLLGSTRAEHAGTVDGSLLGLAGLLKNVSTENGCLAESFRLRYSARSCDSLKKQLESSLHARENDLEHLEDGANGILTSSGNDLVAMNCTADPETEGCQSGSDFVQNSNFDKKE